MEQEEKKDVSEVEENEPVAEEPSEEAAPQTDSSEEGPLLSKEAKKNLWIQLLFCCVGWLMTMTGIGTQYYWNAAIAVATIGCIIIILPSVVSVWRYGLSGLFNTSFIIETTYEDGHKTTESDVGSSLVMKLISILLAVVVGVIATPVRLAIGFYKLYKAEKARGASKKEMQHNLMVPFLTGCISLVGGLVIAGCCFGIGGTIAKNTKPKSDLTDAELLALVPTLKSSLYATEWPYYGPTTSDGETTRMQRATDGSYTLTYTTTTSKNATYKNGTWTLDAGGGALDDALVTTLSSYLYENAWDFDDMTKNISDYYVKKGDSFLYNKQTYNSYTIYAFRKKTVNPYLEVKADDCIYRRLLTDNEACVDITFIASVFNIN